MLRAVGKYHVSRALMALGGAVLLTAGCSTIRIPYAQRAALDHFVGMQRDAVVQALGQPTRVEAQPQAEVLAYDYHGDKWVPGQPWARGPSTDPIGPFVEKVDCTTRFKLAAGVVVAWSLSGHECRTAPYPSVMAAAGNTLARAEQGVDRAEVFQHDRFTGQSVVQGGAFQAQ